MSPRPQTWLVRAARVWDGQTLHAPGFVVISGDRIAVVAEGQPPAALVSTSEVIDLGDATVLPGLIDCHVHLTLPGDGRPVDLLLEDDAQLVALAVRNARTALASGVTTLRDCGGRSRTTLNARRELERSPQSSPRLLVSGFPLTTTNGHCAAFGRVADTAEQLCTAIDELSTIGVDFIKIIGSGGGTPGTVPWLPSYTTESLTAAIDHAHRRGRRVSVHSLNGEATRRAIDAGADHVEHASFTVDGLGSQTFAPDVARALARRDIAVTPTLSTRFHTVRALTDGADGSLDARGELVRWNMMLASHVRQSTAMLAAGVRVVAGTDAGWRHTPFDSLATEVELLCSAGLTPVDAIGCATTDAAKALGLEHETGALRVGMAADLLGVRGDALASASALRDPLFVMRAGVVAVRTRGATPVPARD
jgi:imidazolonepropionase-like amidohydrolase